MAEKQQHHEIRSCRLCGSAELETILKLTPTPPANNLILKEDLERNFPVIPLEVGRCDNCYHLQLCHVVSPELLFSNYLYVSSTSPVMIDHLTRQADNLAAKIKGASNTFVVEIGSNDGTLLHNFQRHGFRVLGIDPAEKIATQAIASGVPTEVAFFNEDVAQRVAEKHGRAGLVCANHCFAHIDDIHSVVEGVKCLLDDSAEFVFEVGYLLDVYQNTLFDTIYHEHLDFHHVAPLVSFFESHGMTLVHVERHNIQGGALRGFVRLGKVAPCPSVAELLAVENEAGINRKETFKSFEKSINYLATNLKTLLTELTSRGKRVYGFGVPAKATTMMYHFGITNKLIPIIADDNPLKQGRYVAGLNIEITSRQAIYEDKPEYVLLLAWNFADSIIERNLEFLEAGGTFIVPIPTLQLIDKNGAHEWTAPL
jgi:hypothetical protein